MAVRGVKPAFSDPVLLEKQIEAYFDACEASKQVFSLKNGDIKIRQTFPSVVGLALSLGVHKDTIYSYINEEPKSHLKEMSDSSGSSDGDYDSLQNRISDLLSRARDRIEVSTYGAVASGDFEPRLGSMIMGNFGYAKPEDDSKAVKILVQAANSSDLSDYSR